MISSFKFAQNAAPSVSHAQTSISVHHATATESCIQIPGSVNAHQPISKIVLINARNAASSVKHVLKLLTACPAKQTCTES